MMSRTSLLRTIISILAAATLFSCSDDNDNNENKGNTPSNNQPDPNDPGNNQDDKDKKPDPQDPNAPQTFESAAFVISPAKGLMTNENGSSTTFEVSLKNAPKANVVLHLTGTPSTEGKVEPADLTFDATNYDTPQTVTVTGVDDSVKDGNQIFTVSIKGESGDATFNGITQTVEIVNVDDEVNPQYPQPNTLLYMAPDEGLETDEFGTRTYLEFQLSNRPAYDVVVTLESTRPDEAVPERTQFVIEPDSWEQITEVPVIGVEDNKADGNQPFSIRIADIQSDDPSIIREAYDYSNNKFSQEISGMTYDIDGEALNGLDVQNEDDSSDPQNSLDHHSLQTAAGYQYH